MTSLIPLKDAVHFFPPTDGKAVTVRTLKRRIKIGVRGIRLMGRFDGHRWLTSWRWVEEYLAAQTHQNGGSPRAQEERVSSHQQATETLKRRFGYGTATDEILFDTKVQRTQAATGLV